MASFTASAVAVCRSRSTISRRSGYSRTSPPPSDSNDPSLGSWLEIPAESDFPLQNLPFGVIGRDGEEHIAVAIGENALDLYVAGAFGLLDEIADREIFLAPTLNALLHQRSEVWTATRRRVSQLLRAGNRELHEARIAESALPRRDRVHSLLPVEIGDFVDFYASLEHATNDAKISPMFKALMKFSLALC